MVGEKDKHKQALDMYLLGRPIIDIARSFGVTVQAVHKWKKQYGWEKAMEDRKTKTQENIDEKYSKIRESLLKGSQLVLAKYFGDLQKALIENPDNVKITDTQAIRFADLLETITRPKTLISEHPADVISLNKLLEVVNDAKRGDTNTPRKPELPDKKQESKRTD